MSRMMFNSTDSPYLPDAQKNAVKVVAVRARLVVVAARVSIRVQ